MLLKFFKRGGTDDDRRTLGGSAVKTYLLGTEEKPRENARLLLGSPDEDTEIINGLKFAKVYTSGCLSFHEDERITEQQKYDIIEDFEKMMFVGLEPHQYTSYWVEHTDKNRLELNFVFPNVELTSGKSLQVYYHFRDLNLVNAWKDLTNDKYGLINPSDLDKRRDVTPSIAPNIMKDWATSDKQSIIDKLKRFTEAEDIKTQLTDLVLTQAELRRQQGSPLNSQDDIADMLKEYGFKISRKGKDSISIKNPDPTKKNIKLKGAIYESDVTADIISHIAQRSSPNPTTNHDETSERADRTRRAETTFSTELEKRRERHHQRYATAREPTIGLPNSEPSLERQQSGATPDLARPNPTETALSESSLSPNPTADSTEFNRAGHEFERPATTDHQENREEWRETSPSDGQRGTENHRAQQKELSEHPSQIQRSASRDLRNPNSEQHRDEPTYQDVQLRKNADNRQHGFLIGNDVYRIDGAILIDFHQLSDLATNQPQRRYEAGATPNTRQQNQQNPRRAEVIDDGAGERAGQRAGDSHQLQAKYPTQFNQYQWTATASGLARPNPYQIKVKKIENDANESTNPLGKLYVPTDPDNNDPTAHYRQLEQVIERFTPTYRQHIGTSHPATTSSEPANDNRVSQATFNTAIRTALGTHRRANPTADPIPQSTNQRLLGRIKQATDRRNSNTEKRARRISTLATKNTNSIDQIGEYTTRRRQRNTAVLEQFDEFGERFTELDSAERARTNGFIGINQRLRKLKRRNAEQNQQLDTATNAIGAVCTVVKAVAQFFVNVLEKLFGKLSKDIQGMDLVSAKTGKIASSQEKQNWVESHPFSLSWYDFLKAEANRLKKEKDNSPRPRFF